MADIICVKDLVKNYGEILAVKGISFNVGEGSLFAFLGPNGAGKSTTINILCTLLNRTSGSVFLDGYEVGQDDDRVRESIGVVFQENVLDELLTVKENLLFRGVLYGYSGSKLQARLNYVKNTMDIADILNRRYGNLSGGQKRRVEIARALMSEPKILFLDEPTTGLDPQTRSNVWQTVRKLQRELNMTVFLTTHYMEEAASADMVAIIDNGAIVAQGTPNDLKAKYSSDMLKIAPKDIAKTESDLKAGGFKAERVADTLHVPVKDSMQAYGVLKRYEGTYRDFEVVKGNMDDVFLNITGHKIREEN